MKESTRVGFGWLCWGVGIISIVLGKDILGGLLIIAMAIFFHPGSKQ